MKRGTKLLILLAVLAVVGLGAWLAARYTAQLEAEEESAGVAVLSIDTETVTALGWTYDGETVSLACADGQWSYADSDACPIDQSYPQNMVDTLAEVLAQETIAEPEDLASYGLDDPQCTVTLTADGTDYELLIGDETVLGGQLYLSTGDGSVYLVDTSLLDAFAYGLYDIIQMEEIPAMDDVSALTIDGETRTMEIRRQEDNGLAYSDDYVWFLAEGGDWLALDTDLTESLVETVTGLTWQSCVSYDASEEEPDHFPTPDHILPAQLAHHAIGRLEDQPKDHQPQHNGDQIQNGVEQRALLHLIGYQIHHYAHQPAQKGGAVFRLDVPQAVQAHQVDDPAHGHRYAADQSEQQRKFQTAPYIHGKGVGQSSHQHDDHHHQHNDHGDHTDHVSLPHLAQLSLCPFSLFHLLKHTWFSPFPFLLPP